MVAPINPIPLYRNRDGDSYEPAQAFNEHGQPLAYIPSKVVMATPIIIKRTDHGFWAAMALGVLALVLWAIGIPVLAVLVVGLVTGIVIGAGLMAAWGRK